MITNRKAWTLIAVTTAALMGGVAPVASAGDVYWSVRSSSCSPYTSSYAGFLTIDGRRFTIRSYNNIGRQIAHAFRRAGYDASCRDGRVIVCYDYRCPPRVRWQTRGYRASFERCDGRMEICWSRVNYSGYRNSYRSDYHGPYWDKDRGYRSKRRYVRRRWCD